MTENDIPFSIIKGNSEHITYILRAGMDYNDATLYYLKNFENLQDPDTINTINLLVLEHEFLNVRNQYESYGNQRKDERLLGTFVFKDDDTGVNALKN